MSVNKFMHPRNIYKTPANFKQMAIDYPEFRKYVKQDITGKIRIDFKDKETLRSLTQTLLKKDFDLDVTIPLDHLIPTVPLRLNYILWLEDLLSICTDKSAENIHGIDIGTGACCIYPLLAAKKNHWSMTATEINSNSLNIAQENIHKNHLEHLITIKSGCHETLLKSWIDPNITYDFCMCNPPFFSSTSDLDPKTKSRTERRSLPRNALTGVPCEIVSQGGEVEFISKLIQESVELKSQIRIFTSMVGQKSSIAPLKAILRSAEVVSFKQTEFHQGHTTRWGLSWTFHNIDLRTVPQATVAAARKKPKPPQNFVLPPSYENLEDVITKTRQLFQTLQMEYEEIRKNQFMYAFHVMAKENTWSHQRRKRREQMRIQPSANSSKEDLEMDVDTSVESVDQPQHQLQSQPQQKRSREDSASDEEAYYNVKKLKIQEQNIVVRFTCIIRKLSDEFHLEMAYIDGQAGKDSVHQIMQYFKNHLK